MNSSNYMNHKMQNFNNSHFSLQPNNLQQHHQQLHPPQSQHPLLQTHVQAGYQDPNYFENKSATHAMNNLGNVINNLVNSRLAQQLPVYQNQHPHNQHPQSFQPHQMNQSPLPYAFTNSELKNKFKNSGMIDESKCHVCGDKSTGSHFGGISCESCKAFFRRSVQKNRHVDYKCSYSGECKMNTSTRKICQFCRYKHCILIGMKSKWVLSDDERHQKYGNRRKQIKITESASTNHSIEPRPKELKTNSSSIDKEKSAKTSKTSTEQSSPSSVSDDESCNSNSNSKSNLLDSAKLSSDCVNLTTYELNSEEKGLIDRISMSYYHSRKYNAIDLNIQSKLANLFQTQSESSIKKMAKVLLANFIVQPVKRVITFAKLIADFRELDIEDQLVLLQGGTLELFICSSSSLYDSVSNKMVNVVSKERNIDGKDQSNLQLDIMRLMWNEEVFFKTISFYKSMHQFQLDEATLILLIPLILFTPDRRNLVNKKRVFELQAKYSFLLKKYMVWKFGKQHASKLLPKLLLKLIELRSLHEMHSSILLDADQTQLDPFSLALLVNIKDDKCLTNPQTKSPTEESTKGGADLPVKDITDVEDVKVKSDSSTVTSKTDISNSNSDSIMNHHSSILTPDSLASSGPNSSSNQHISSVDSVNSENIDVLNSNDSS